MNRQQKRKQRTRRLLKQTTRDLLIAHGYHAITVQQITDSADLARGTFYVHFADKESIVWELVEELLRDLAAVAQQFEPITSEAQRYQKWLALFQGIAEHKALIATLLGNNGDVGLIGRFQQFLAMVMEDGLQNNRVPFLEQVPRSVAARFLAGGLMQLIVWWFEQDGVSAETITNHFMSIIQSELIM